jgi:hypothetical protein
MREILANQLWIGNAGDGRDPERLLQAGLVAVVNLAAEEPSPVLPRSMIYCHFPLVDGPQDDAGVLDVAIQTVVSLLKKRVPTLVYCGAGMSRSPAVVAAALSIVQGRSPDEKLKEIVAGHPHDVSPHLWEAVQRTCRATTNQRRMPMFFSAGEGDEGAEKMQEFFGPTQIDHFIRQAIQFCWMALPKEKRNVDELERQIRRLVDRALRDVREDFNEFFGQKGSE